MRALTVSNGAGRAAGQQLVLPDADTTAEALFAALRTLPSEQGGWWAHGAFRAGAVTQGGTTVHRADHYRLGALWHSSIAVVVDLDRAGHSPWPENERALLLEALAAETLPGSIAEITPHGLRVVFSLIDAAEDAAEWEQAARGACELCAQVVAGLGGLHLLVDEGASTDRARFFWSPRAVLRKPDGECACRFCAGDPRACELMLLRARDWTLQELAAHAPREPERQPITGAIPEGKRHETMKHLAARRRSEGHDPQEIYDSLQVVNGSRCKPPLPDHEVRELAQWFEGKDGATLGGTTAVPPPWSKPVPFTDLGALPDFPVKRLPWWLSCFVEALGTETQTPLGLCGPMCLAVLAAAVQRKVSIVVRPGWVEPANVWMVAALESGGRKSAVFTRAAKPIEDRERELAIGLSEKIAEAEEEAAAIDGALQAKRREHTKAETPELRTVLLREAKELAVQLKRLKATVPTAPHLIAADVTTERLGAMLAQNGGRMAVFSDEGTLFKVAGGLYSKNDSSNIDVLLKAHSGTTIRTDRQGREGVFVPLPALTLGLLVQPTVVRGLTQNPHFRGEGFLARIAYSLPVSMVGHRDEDAPPIPLEVGQRYEEVVGALLRLPDAIDDQGDPVPHVMHVSDDARSKLVRGFMRRIEPRLGRDGDLGHMADWGGKAAGLAVRLAGVIHLAEHTQEREPWTVPISATAMDCGIALAEEYFLPHALAAFDLMGATAEVDLARGILRWVAEHRAERFTRANLHRQLRRRVREGHPEEWDTPLRLLVSLGYLRSTDGGAKAGEYEVNPDVLEGGAA